MIQQPIINALLQQAVTCFQQGRLQEANTLTQRLLAEIPDHANASQLLCLIAGRLGDLKQADRLLCDAIRKSPGTLAYYHSRVLVLLQDQRLEEAADTCKKAIAINPDLADSYNNLAFILNQLDRAEEALDACDRAVELQPQLGAAHNNRAISLGALGRMEESLLAAELALRYQPDLVEAHLNRGNALRELGRLDEAMQAYEQLIALRPDNALAYSSLGVVQWKKGLPDAALKTLEHAIRMNPGYAEAYSHLGLVLRDLGRLEEALGAQRKAISLKPDYAAAHNNLGMVLLDLGRLKDAIAATEHAISLEPDYAIAHYNLALSLLLDGRFDRGWKEHEWRWKGLGIPDPGNGLHQARWDGSPLAGKTILLIAEQGYGDAIQFIRYVPLIAEAGCRIVVQCKSELFRLFSGMKEIGCLVNLDETPPDFDVYAPLLSLPYILGTTLETIPANCPYLHAPPLPAPVRERLGLTDASRNIGIVWAGNPDHKNDRNRSTQLELFRFLLAIPGIRIFSLQVGDRAADLDMNKEMGGITDTSPFISTYYDTATIIQHLDLVISVDTSVVHLAGALGVPVWVLLPYVPDWRWLQEREDSPWYPGMRLFRQPSRGDWESVFRLMDESLKKEYSQ